MPVFNERGLVLLKPCQLLSSRVPVSSGDLSGQEGNEDLEGTLEGVGETSPLWQSELLRAFSNDDNTDERLVEGSLRSTRVATRSGAPL